LTGIDWRIATRLAEMQEVATIVADVLFCPELLKKLRQITFISHQ
jgi:hypothetical protein